MDGGLAVAATVAWVLSVVAGAYLMVSWLAAGGLRGQPTKVTRFPSVVVVGHPVAALAGLAIWVGFLATARDAYAWSAFGMLAVVALLGFVLFTRWLVGQGGRHARGAEQEFPSVAVLVHGVVAVATFILVFLAASRRLWSRRLWSRRYWSRRLWPRRLWSRRL